MHVEDVQIGRRNKDDGARITTDNRFIAFHSRLMLARRGGAVGLEALDDATGGEQKSCKITQ